MKLVWSPEMASKAYIDTVKRARGGTNPGDAEFLSAMAAGYNVKLIVEVRRNMNAAGASAAGAIDMSVGLAVAAADTGGRHLCVVADEAARRDYVNAMQEADVALPEVVVVGEAERVVEGLEGVDFLVVHGRGGREIFRRAKLSRRGAILVYKGGNKTAASSRFCWGGTVDNSNLRIVKSVSFPLENGLEIAYVGENDGKTLKSPKRWIRRIDLQSGEEHVFRR